MWCSASTRCCWVGMRCTAKPSNGAPTPAHRYSFSSKIVRSPLAPSRNFGKRRLFSLSTIFVAEDRCHGTRTSSRLGRCDFHLDHPSSRSVRSRHPKDRRLYHHSRDRLDRRLVGGKGSGGASSQHPLQ